MREREDCGSYTEGMSGTDSYEGQVSIVKLLDYHDDDKNGNLNAQGCTPGGGYLGSYQRIRHLSGLSEGPPGGYPPNNYG